MQRIKQLIAVVTTMLLLTATTFSQSRYFQFGNLNQAAVNVTSTWTRLNTTTGTHSFTKSSGTTKLEVYVNSRFGIGVLSGGAQGVRFQVRVDNSTPTFDNQGSIRASNTTDFLSILAVFENLPAGNHTVSIWAQAPSGAATAVVVDPGGWGGKIIVKETA